MKINSFREAFSEILINAGKMFKDIVVIDADVAKSTRTIKFAEKFPERFIEVGISEQDLIGTAAGLAIAGKIPIASAFAMFMLRAWEQIRNTIARDNLNVKLVATHAGLSDYLDGPSHQCLEDITVMRVLPNMTVLVPADTISFKKLFLESIMIKRPVYIRLGRDFAPKVYDDTSEVVIGKPVILKEGKDLCIIASGVMVYMALKASELLKDKGLNVMVVDIHTIKPLDSDTLIKIAKEVKGFIVVEEHNIIGGLGGAIAELLSETIPRPIKRIGVNDSFGACSRDYLSLLRHYGLTEKGIVKAVEVLAHELRI